MNIHVSSIHAPAWIFILVLLGGLLLFFGRMIHDQKNEWGRHPHRRLNDRTPGLAWFTGRVTPIKTIQSPYLKKPSVYYAFRFYRYDKAGWLLAHGDSQRESFILSDGAGKARVELANAEISLYAIVNEKVRQSDLGAIRRLEAIGVPHLGNLDSEPGRIEEELIAPEETISMLGTLMPEDSLSGDRLQRIAPLKLWSEVWFKDYLEAEKPTYFVLRAIGAALLAGALLLFLAYCLAGAGVYGFY